jgi:D-alanyl-D-alanine carboxypeptidase
MNYHIYVSKKVSLPDGFVPLNLVDANCKYKAGIKVEKTAYEEWLKLKKNFEMEGYIIDIESAYRSYDYQAKILEELAALKGEEYASTAVALPGHSEHQTGLAIDFCVLKNGVYLNSDDTPEEMLNLEECKYAATVAHRYGFIIRYPKGKEPITGYKYEPWHLRYVGIELATYLYKNSLTLDEYYNEKRS